jgi:hypothetical protein
MWVNGKKYNELLKENSELKSKIRSLEDDSPEGIVNRALEIIKKVGKEAENDKDYQAMLKTLYLSQIGKLDPTMKGYSQTQFVKDNDSVVLERLEELENKSRMIRTNKAIEYKKRR